MRLRLLAIFPLLVAVSGPAPAQDPAAGARAFLQCRACHSLKPGENKVGPTLHGLFNRRPGTQPGYAYSPALKASRFVWNRATLDRFLLAPRRAVPGNKMAYGGLPDAQRRAALISYLEKETR
jgi:cytochrome c